MFVLVFNIVKSINCKVESILLLIAYNPVLILY